MSFFSSSSSQLAAAFALFPAAGDEAEHRLDDGAEARVAQEQLRHRLLAEQRAEGLEDPHAQHLQVARDLPRHAQDRLRQRQPHRLRVAQLQVQPTPKRAAAHSPVRGARLVRVGRVRQELRELPRCTSRPSPACSAAPRGSWSHAIGASRRFSGLPTFSSSGVSSSSVATCSVLAAVMPDSPGDTTVNVSANSCAPIAYGLPWLVVETEVAAAYVSHRPRAPTSGCSSTGQ